MKRIVIATLLAAASAGGAVTLHAFNDKGAIVHNGRVLCVDWHGWTQHQLHGDQPYGEFPYSCDVP